MNFIVIRQLYNELTEYIFENGPYLVFCLVCKHKPSRDWVRRLNVPLLYLHTVFDTISKQKAA